MHENDLVKLKGARRLGQTNLAWQLHVAGILTWFPKSRSQFIKTGREVHHDEVTPPEGVSIPVGDLITERWLLERKGIDTSTAQVVSTAEEAHTRDGIVARSDCKSLAELGEKIAAQIRAGRGIHLRKEEGQLILDAMTAALPEAAPAPAPRPDRRQRAAMLGLRVLGGGRMLR